MVNSVFFDKMISGKSETGKGDNIVWLNICGIGVGRNTAFVAVFDIYTDKSIRNITIANSNISGNHKGYCCIAMHKRPLAGLIAIPHIWPAERIHSTSVNRYSVYGNIAGAQYPERSVGFELPGKAWNFCFIAIFRGGVYLVVVLDYRFCQ